MEELLRSNGELRDCEVNSVGRIAKPGLVKVGDLVHFKLDCGLEGGPLHCICNGRTAENALRYLQAGDETTVEGSLIWVNFRGKGKTLVIYARHTSYGRKAGGLRPAFWQG